MALRALDNSEHSRLLKKISDMPYEENKAYRLEQELAKFYEEYHTLLVELAGVIANYRAIAAKINERQPLVKRKEPQQV